MRVDVGARGDGARQASKENGTAEVTTREDGERGGCPNSVEADDGSASDPVAPWFASSYPSEHLKIMTHLQSYLGRQVRVMEGDWKGECGKIVRVAKGYAYVKLEGVEELMRYAPRELSHVMNGRRLVNMVVDNGGGTKAQAAKRKRLACEDANETPISDRYVIVTNGSNRGRKGRVITGTQGYYLVKVANCLQHFTHLTCHLCSKPFWVYTR